MVYKRKTQSVDGGSRRDPAARPQTVEDSAPSHDTHIAGIITDHGNSSNAGVSLRAHEHSDKSTEDKSQTQFQSRKKRAIILSVDVENGLENLDASSGSDAVSIQGITEAENILTESDSRDVTTKSVLDHQDNEPENLEEAVCSNGEYPLSQVQPRRTKAKGTPEDVSSGHTMVDSEGCAKVEDTLTPPHSPNESTRGGSDIDSDDFPVFDSTGDTTKDDVSLSVEPPN